MKLCRKCNNIKTLDCFGKHKRHNDGYQSSCKECKKVSDKKYKQNNYEKVLAAKKHYRENNKEKVCQQKRNSYLKNKEYYLKIFKKYNKENVEKIKNYLNYKYKNDINFKITKLLRSRILTAIKKHKKYVKTMELIGSSLEELKQHLQETAIKNGYLDFNINNYDSNKYHIDHIIPCSSFNLQTLEEQKKCFNYKNLQILTW